MRLDHESLVVLRPALSDDFVNRARWGDALEKFLEFSLWIDIDRCLGDLLEIVLRLFENKLAGRLEAAVEIDRADQGFECISECRGPIAPTACLLAATEFQVGTKVDGKGICA